MADKSQYEQMLRALAREIARIRERQLRAEVIATLYLAGLRPDGFSDPEVA